MRRPTRSWRRKWKRYLADKWKAAGNPKLTHAAKVEALRKSIAARSLAAKISARNG